MYRLNCNLADEIAERLGDYSKRTGIAKANVVAMALDQYLQEAEMKRKLMERMSDPEEMAKIFKMLGNSAPVLAGIDDED